MQFIQELTARAITLPNTNPAILGVLYLESVPTMCSIQSNRAPLMHKQLQSERENDDILTVKALYQILQVGNLEKLANEAGRFNLLYKLDIKSATHTHTHTHTQSEHNNYSSCTCAER